MRHLFVTTAPPLPIPCIPLARAGICCDCECLMPLRNTCPNCASEAVRPLASWLFTTLQEGRA